MTKHVFFFSFLAPLFQTAIRWNDLFVIVVFIFRLEETENRFRLDSNCSIGRLGDFAAYSADRRWRRLRLGICGRLLASAIEAISNATINKKETGLF